MPHLRLLVPVAAALALLTGVTTARADSTREASTSPVESRQPSPWVRELAAGHLDLAAGTTAALDLAQAATRIGHRLARGRTGRALAVLGMVAGPAPALAPAVHDVGPLTARPVAGELSSGFGVRRDPIRHRRRQNHKGFDIRADRNTPVHAAGAGTVVRARRERGYGRVIYVDHGGGLQTRYAHLQSIGVHVGDEVVAGEVIGKVGSSGRATGPHLHFEVREDGKAIPPDTIAGLPLFGERRTSSLSQLLAPIGEAAVAAVSATVENDKASRPVHKHRARPRKHHKSPPLRSQRPRV